LRVRARVHGGRQQDAIAADDSGRRVHDHALANARSLRIERLLYDERSPMLALCQDAARADALEAKREARIPARRLRLPCWRVRTLDAGSREGHQIG
jgi:hypothetical protein